MSDADGKIRIDKWLWYARFFKSRNLASKQCAGGKIRLDKEPLNKASQTLRVGQVLTFEQGQIIRVIRVLALGNRRGPAVEAQQLYEDLSSEQGTVAAKRTEPLNHAVREPGSGRPTKRERRDIERLRSDRY